MLDYLVPEHPTFFAVAYLVNLTSLPKYAYFLLNLSLSLPSPFPCSLRTSPIAMSLALPSNALAWFSLSFVVYHVP